MTTLMLHVKQWRHEGRSYPLPRCRFCPFTARRDTAGVADWGEMLAHLVKDHNYEYNRARDWAERMTPGAGVRRA